MKFPLAQTLVLLMATLKIVQASSIKVLVAAEHPTTDTSKVLKIAQTSNAPPATSEQSTANSTKALETAQVSKTPATTEHASASTPKAAKDSYSAQCGDPTAAVPLLRAWSGRAGDHFYTTNAVEMDYAVANYGYTAEGTTGYVFSNRQPGSIPFYRLWKAGAADHFYTTSAVERDNAINRFGYVSEGVVGYVYPDTACGGLALYRSFNGGIADHFYTMSEAEKDNAIKIGWAYEGIAAYIFPF